MSEDAGHPEDPKTSEPTERYDRHDHLSETPGSPDTQGNPKTHGSPEVHGIDAGGHHTAIDSSGNQESLRKTEPQPTSGTPDLLSAIPESQSSSTVNMGSQASTADIAGPREDRVHREVVSYVRRSARLNQSQQKAWDRWSDELVQEVPSGSRSTSVATGATIDWDSIFQRQAPLIMEIGSGTGRSLVPMAARHPEANVIACEVYQPAVASTLSRIKRAEVSNVRIVMADGEQVLRELVPTGGLSELWVFFPDPWHKARHHKRRLINRNFASLVADRLQPGGRWRIATDWPDYAEWIREEVGHEDRLILDVEVEHSDGSFNADSDATSRAVERPLTKYEKRGLTAGRSITDFEYYKPEA